MADKINVLIPEETVDAKIKEIGEQISKDYAGKEVHLICILKGGVFFACELAKRITVPVSLDFMQVSSYGDATESSGIVRIKKDLDDTMENKEVIIVEDIIDSGRTLHYLIPVLKQRNPKSIRLCALLNKPDRREVEVQIDYLGFDIPDDELFAKSLRNGFGKHGFAGTGLALDEQGLLQGDGNIYRTHQLFAGYIIFTSFKCEIHFWFTPFLNLVCIRNI